MKHFFVTVMFASIGFVTCASAEAASKMFLKFDGIDGESAAAGHEEWIDLEDFSWGIGFPPSLQTFNFTKRIDATTPTLVEDLIAGTHIKSAELDIVNQSSGPQSLFSFSFNDVVLQDMSFNGRLFTTVEAGPIDTWGFNFSKVTLTDFPVDSSGHPLPPVTMSWDGSLLNPVPEPSSWLMLACGALLFMTRRFWIKV